jgi:hypothetical protein
MPVKVKTTRFMHDVRVSTPSPVRRELTKPPGLYVLELRSHVPQGQLPKRNLVITIDAKSSEDSLPKPVKITHT